jgi:hypothetical protein
MGETGYGKRRYLSVKWEFSKNTPAREAGISQSKWTLKELLTFRWFKTPIT